MEDQMTFDEALANMIERFDHAATLPPGERNQYAHDSAGVEDRYPEGFVARLAKAIRLLQTGAKTKHEQRLRDIADPRFIRLNDAVSLIGNDLVKR